MNITSQRDNEEEEEEDREFSVLESDEFDTTQQRPPYTPRTAARRAKDRIDRSQISVHPGRDLTSKFQNIFDEEKQERTPLFNRTSDYLFAGEEENVDPFPDNDSSSSRPLLSSRNTSFSETNTRKIESLNFVEDSDSESDNESHITHLNFF